MLFLSLIASQSEPLGYITTRVRANAGTIPCGSFFWRRDQLAMDVGRSPLGVTASARTTDVLVGCLSRSCRCCTCRWRSMASRSAAAASSALKLGCSSREWLYAGFDGRLRLHVHAVTGDLQAALW